MFRDFEAVDQRELLTNVTCPVLIIHGNDPGDLEEMLLLERSRRGMQLLSSDSRLEIIEGAGHSLGDYLDRAIGLANEWFLRFLPLR